MRQFFNIGHKIKSRRLARDIGRAEAALAAGISYDYLAKIENNQRHPNLAVLEAIARAIGATLIELVGEGDAPPPPAPNLFQLGVGKPVPRIGWARAGAFAEASDMSFQPGDAEEWVYSSRGGGRVYALRIEGDSMAPEFEPGEIVVVDPDRQAAPGDFVIAKIEDDNEATFKQFKYDANARPILRPLNRAYPDIPIDEDRPARIVGVVIEKKTVFGHHDRRRKLLDRIAERLENLDDKELERAANVLEAMAAR